MGRVRGLWAWVRDRVRRGRADREADEEFRFHIDMEIEKNLRAGMEAAEARRQALIAFGGAERHRERLREGRSLPILDALGSDLRFAVRSLKRVPGPSLIAIASIGLGVAGSTTVFTVSSDLLFRAPPVPAAEELVRVAERRSFSNRAGPEGLQMRYPRFLTYEERTSEVFAAFAGHRQQTVAVRFDQGTYSINGTAVTAAYFETAGIRPFLGRFTTSDVAPEVVVSHRLWRERLRADPSAVGRTLYVDGRPLEIVAVAPATFEGLAPPLAIELWVPVRALGASPADSLDPGWVAPFGRVRAGVDRRAVAAAVEVVGLGVPLDEENETVRWVQVQTLRGLPTQEGAERALVFGIFGMILGMPLLVLLIASANVAGMMLARSLSRRRELALRLAIGAQRLRIVRHLSVETLVLFAIGGGLGVALAYGWAAPLESLVRPWSAYEDVAVNAQPQAQALTFALLVTGVTGLVFALIPALQSSKPDLVSSLRGGGRWSVTRAMGRDLFVGSQIAMSALLLLVAGLLVRSLQRSLDVDLGFRHEDVVLATTDLAPHDYDEERGRAYYERLLAESKAIPGVRAAGLSQFVLMSPGRSRGPIVRDDETSDGERRQMTSFNVVTPDYLETVGLELVAGRWFTERDSEGTPPVAVINQTLAARLWPGESPLGASFRRLGGDPYGVVGVVKDGKYQFLAEGETSFVFFPFGQSYRPQMTLHVRAPEQLASVSLAVQDIVRRLDPDIAIEGSRTYAEVLDLATFPYRVAASMTGVFGLIGLALSVIGVYGVLSFQVAQRTREFGVRRALGAPAATLLGGVVRRGVGLAAVGCAFGLLLGGGVGQLLRSFLVDLSPLDPPTFVGIPLLLLLAAALASLVPALRATSVDAMESLREE